MKKLETAVLGGLVGAIAGVVTTANLDWPGWAIIIAAAAIGLAVGYAWAVLRP